MAESAKASMPITVPRTRTPGRLPADDAGRKAIGMRGLRRLLLVSAVLGSTADVSSAEAGPAPALSDVQTVALPGVQRRIDHFAVDPAGQRLFVAALGNHTLEVLDVAAGKRITSIPGLDEPQGVAYLPSFHRIVVATRSGGTLTAFDDTSYQPVTTITGMSDADNLRFDAAAGMLYVGHGDGALGVVDPASMKTTADIRLPGHPESFRLEDGGPRIFVNVPTTREILVVDRTQRAIASHIPLGNMLNNYPMSLDESRHRLFVGVRQPARLVVIDTTTSKQIAAVPCVGDTDDLFFDGSRQRVYVVGGEGYVDVFDASSPASYPRIARIPTRVGARTGLWSSELDRLFVAWPSRDGHPAEIHVLAPPAGP
jgi:YVTN family beta-propeller protein